MGALIVDLIIVVIDVLCGLLPAICYLTAVVVVPAITIGRVAVEFPKSFTRSYPSRRTSPDGRTILSPALGAIIGFSFWGAVIALAIIVHEYASGRG
jgi:hypothetical protein